MLMNSSIALLILSFCATAVVSERLDVSPFGPELSNRVWATTGLPQTDAVESPRAAAVSFAKKQYKLSEGDYLVKNAYESAHNGITHVYLRQVVKGQEVANADMNINVDKNGQILSYGSSFIQLTPEVLAKSKTWSGAATGFASPTQALKTLARHLHLTVPGTVTESAGRSPAGVDSVHPTYELAGVPFAEGTVKAEQSYVLNAQGLLVPTWRMNVQMADNWFDAHVAADGSKVVQLIDWVADAQYNVLPIGTNDPAKSKRALLTDPANAKASPKGWHDQGDGKTFTTTIGNNVFAQENWSGGSTYLNNKRPDGGKDLVFDNPLDLTAAPKTYINATTTNLFYWNNIMHDVFYNYGFNEASGNFQANNWDKGGKGNDAVIANAQDGSGTNNANFATPPDGQNGRMRMYVFTMTTPQRDGDLENDIIAHEYTHGISNRLTGGPANSGCLGWGESGGMGEGWSDFFGITLLRKASDTSSLDTGVGDYVLPTKPTIRQYVYSTNMKTNPTTYGFINKGMSEVHATGEIWANILYQMYWNLMDATGNKFNPDWFSADVTSGNTLALQLVVDGMKLQPCNPTFVTARDAILAAEKADTAGKYRCAIWKAFAKRGVGAKATGPAAEDFTLPDDCPKEADPTTTPETPKPDTPETPKPTEPTPTEPKPTEPKPTEPATPSKFNPTAQA